MRALLYALGVLAAAAFVLTKNEAALAWATSGSYRFGDLYRMAPILPFKPAAPMPDGPESQVDSLDRGERLAASDREIFLGDSFGFCDWGERAFHSQLSAALGRPMFQVGNNHHAALWGNPYRLLAVRRDRPAPPAVVYYEIVERSLAPVFGSPLALADRVKPVRAPDSLIGRFKTAEDDLLDHTEERHEILLKHSVFTRPLVSLWDTAVFECFRQTPDETPWYSRHPAWLFYEGEVAAYTAGHDERMVANAADNIARLSRTLRAHFNCTMVFIPVPDKLTVYAQLATPRPYDEFLPRLCRETKARGVCTVELLPRLRRESGPLYWPTDTHWNNAGIRVAVGETVRQLPPGLKGI